MIERYQGPENLQFRLAELERQEIVAGEREIAEAIESVAAFRAVARGDYLIKQHDTTAEVYFIIAGEFEIIVNRHRRYGPRVAGDLIGEMTAIEPRNPRSADVVAVKDGVVAEVACDDFLRLLNKYPKLSFPIAQAACQRLHDRNIYEATVRAMPRVFVMSSREGIPIADTVVDQLKSENIEAIPWYKEGFFAASTFTLETLQNALPEFDFGIAVTTWDDFTFSRWKFRRSMRDNVLFEAGLCMGRMGRRRVFLLQPVESRWFSSKTPSDFLGMTTIRFQPDALTEKIATIAGQIKHDGPLRPLRPLIPD